MRIYCASKIDLADMWIELSGLWTEHEFVASWPEIVVHNGHREAGLSESYYKSCWQRDERDINQAEVLLLFGRPEDKLYGGLVEAGIAIANGAEVIVVGDNPAFSTWQFHPSVFRAKNLAEAREILKVMQWKEQQQ